MTMDEAIQDIKLNIIPFDEGKSLYMAVNALEAWKKTEEELIAYGEKLASINIYDRRIEAVAHCLTVMRKNLEV